MPTPAEIDAATTAGILNAPAIATAADLAGLPFPAALALIQMESGGANIYGHDANGVFTLPAGQTLEVTEDNFAEFLARVTAGETSNGVGPVQITYPGYFPQMIARGLKPWDPVDSCRFGFEIVAATYARYGSWEATGSHYNGGTNPGPRALAYGGRFAAYVTDWTTRLDALQGDPMPTVTPPSPPMIAARWHGGAQTPKVVVIHATVSPCVKGGARSIAHYFATETGKTSAHYVRDPDETIQTVGDHSVAYHCGHNQDSIGYELCDPQAGPSSRWSDANHKAMLAGAADDVARLCLAYGIPIKRISVADLRAGRHGICGHVDMSYAFHASTHTDPGDGFPWASFIGQVQDAADELTAPPKPVTPAKPKPVEPTKPVAFPMPAATQRAHAAVAWKGDSLTGLADVATVPAGADGIKAADRNFQWAWENPAQPVTDVPGHGNAFAMHYATPGQNNFKFILAGDTTRAMTPDELARPILRWPAADVRRWRRAADPASERPATYSEMVNEAVRLGVVICAELKSTAFEYPGPAKQLVQTAKKAGHPPWYMALYKSMGGCKEKCSSVVSNGGQFAVIFGTYQAYRPLFKVAVLTWPVKPTRVW